MHPVDVAVGAAIIRSMSKEDATERYNDRRIKERTQAYRERLRAQGIQEPAPDFPAAAARWKAQREANEKAAALRTYRFVLIIQPVDGEFRASTPTLAGCEARRSTPEEARERLLQVLYTQLTEMLAGGEAPPSDEGAEVVNVVLPIPPQP